MVANYLQPLGIDVDIDVEHKGKRTKCAESEKDDAKAATTEGDDRKNIDKYRSSLHKQSRAKDML